MRTLRDSVLYALAEVASRLLSVVLLARILGPADYGAFAVTNAAIAVLQAISAVGLDAAYLRYWYSEDEDYRPALAATVTRTAIACATLAAAGGVALAPIATGGLGHSEPLGTYLAALVILPCSAFNRMNGQTLRNQVRALTYGWTGALGAAAGVLVGVALYARTASLSVVFLALAMGEVFSGILRAFSVRTLGRGPWRGEIARRVLRFGLPLVPASLAYWVMSLADRLILTRYVSVGDVGRYSVANSIAAFLLILNAGIGSAWTPRALARYSTAIAADWNARSLTAITALMGVAAVASTAFGEAIVTVLASSRYEGAADVVGPLTLGAVALATTHVTALPLVAEGRSSTVAVLSVAAAAVNAGATFALVPRFGLAGAAWATFLGYLTLTLAFAVTTAGGRRHPWSAIFLGAVVVGVVISATRADATTVAGFLSATGHVVLFSAVALPFVRSLRRTYMSSLVP